MDSIIDKATAWVKELTSKNDASRDFCHVQRVLNLAHHIQSSEDNIARQQLDTNIITLAALLHGTSDAKHVRAGEDANTVISNYLRSLGCPSSVADKVQLICSNLSYSHEVDNTILVSQLCSVIPELKVVQDAVRLDSLGAKGIARTFGFVAANLPGHSLDLKYFEDKLLKFEDLMKTKTGKVLARERTQRLRMFMNWWVAEDITRQETIEEITNNRIANDTSHSRQNMRISQAAGLDDRTDQEFQHESRAIVTPGDGVLQASTVRANQLGRTASAAAKVKTRDVIRSEEAARKELARVTHRDSSYIPSSFESDAVSPPPATSHRVVKRASFLQGPNNDTRKRPRRLSDTNENDEADQHLQRNEVFSLPTRSITPTPPVSVAAIMLDEPHFLRRPTTTDERWSIDQAKFEQLDTIAQRNYTHIGLMMETTDGMDNVPKCSRCKEKGHPCRKYRPEVSAAYETKFGLKCEPCALCKWARQTCEQ